MVTVMNEPHFHKKNRHLFHKNSQMAMIWYDYDAITKSTTYK